MGVLSRIVLRATDQVDAVAVVLVGDAGLHEVGRGHDVAEGDGRGGGALQGDLDGDLLVAHEEGGGTRHGVVAVGVVGHDGDLNAVVPRDDQRAGGNAVDDSSHYGSF